MIATPEIKIGMRRNYLSNDFKIDTWEHLQPIYEELKNRTLNNVGDLVQWLKDNSELQAVVSEDLAWRYIKMNIDTTDEKLTNDFQYFIENIQPNIAPYENDFHKKLIDCAFLNELEAGKYDIYLREVRKDIEIFREKNIPLQTKLESLGQKYGTISAAMTVEIDGKEMTLQQAAKFLKDTNREKREAVYKKVQDRRIEDKDKINGLFSELIKLRDEMAKNADFNNFRDYMFKALGRFDYTKEDCFKFHDAIAQEIVPICNNIDENRKNLLHLDNLKPWDTSVDTSGKEPLKPFDTIDELVSKTITCFSRLRPYFGECIAKMQEMRHLDLASKKGKAPGGFNYPLNESGAPFIYMNAVGTFRDMVTLMHEGGHAVHAFLCNDLELNAFKSVPSEVAELASMSMELMSMEHWDIFFEDEQELKRAKKEQLEGVLSTLPWIAAIDQFQHKIYEKPTHSFDERYKMWQTTYKQFGSAIVDWNGLESYHKNVWQKQLHLFEVPFYYIEYGFAQLGAIAVWRNFKQDKEKALDAYMSALKLGYTKPIGEIYKTANIRFDFSTEYVKELAAFVSEELQKLN